MSNSHPKSGTLALTLGALGVVYGDIGTSPLYAFKESLAAAAGNGSPDAGMVLGILSLVLWSLFIVVTIKYVVIVLRADNQGEGGILSLMVLAQKAVGRKPWIAVLSMTGCALFFGDALITPAISVLSAVEGLSLVTERFAPWVNPIALTIIVALFMVQRFGTSGVARYFGPVMVAWFAALAAGGIYHINDQPQVWQAFNPYYAFVFLTEYGTASIIAFGAVVLAVTGAEALYADLGHFGKKPIRSAWLFLVFPSLMLNYIGQAALVLSHPEAAHNSFFLLYPDWALLPMVILAGMATVIASQAVITGAYSLAHQAVQLGLLPRLTVRYTSKEQSGQIYISQVNWLLMAGVILLIEIFKNSSNLASAYGMAVTGTMVITAAVAFVVVRHEWRWSLAAAVAVIGPLFLIDAAFFAATLTKFFSGGFVPVVLAAVIVLMMRTWVRGSRSVEEQSFHEHTTMASLLKGLDHVPPKRVDGTAFYLTSSVEYAPSALLQNLQHNKVIHEKNILLTLRFEPRPHVPDEERVKQETLSRDFVRLYMHFGYMETPNVIRGLRLWRAKGGQFDVGTSSFFLSRRNIVPSAKFGMPLWRDKLYIAMANNASDAADYFRLPLNRVVELGVQMTV